MTLTRRIRSGGARVVADETVGLRRVWRGDSCRCTLTNRTRRPAQVREVVLYDGAHGLPGGTPLYGEAFQMLSQLSGTLASPVDVGTYPDRSHYKIPEPDGLRTAYGVLALSPERGPQTLIGFTSCRRFVGRIGFDAERLRISLDTEGLTLAPGETWTLDELAVYEGDDRPALLERFARTIGRHHRPLHRRPVPTGWCSWYHYGPSVTADDIAQNLDWIAMNVPQLRYIQLDDGYQPHMGDWLDVGAAFGGDVRSVLASIRAKGFEPAIWVAPFIADAQSRLFREHPDWFVQGDDGKPMPSDRVGFGGWRMGPWYCVDGTHPDAQRHLESLFHTLRREWGCTYFKLDANYWGAIHGGRRHDPKATRVEAYRRGMAAIRRGAGDDSVILGCNHPIWPSLGEIHASRSSNDIGRSWESFVETGRENLLRGWQNGRFWWNDPDCLLLTGDLPESAFVFHAVTLYATGGMVLAGDAMAQIPAHRRDLLRRLLPATGVAARFADDALTVGRIPLRGRDRWALRNATDAPAVRTVPIEARSSVRDVLTGEDLPDAAGPIKLTLPARSARLLETRPL